MSKMKDAHRHFDKIPILEKLCGQGDFFTQMHEDANMKFRKNHQQEFWNRIKKKFCFIQKLIDARKNFI